jgi:hypothetical protein
MSATTPGEEPGARLDWWGVFALACLACSTALSGWLAWCLATTLLGWVR